MLSLEKVLIISVWSINTKR